MSQKSSHERGGYEIANKDNSKRGRDASDTYEIIGQKIPKGVRDQIEKGKK